MTIVSWVWMTLKSLHSLENEEHSLSHEHKQQISHILNCIGLAILARTEPPRLCYISNAFISVRVHVVADVELTKECCKGWKMWFHIMSLHSNSFIWLTLQILHIIGFKRGFVMNAQISVVSVLWFKSRFTCLGKRELSPTVMWTYTMYIPFFP